MRVIKKRELYIATRNSDNTFNEPEPVYGSFGDVTSKVLSAIVVDNGILDVGKVQKVLNLPITEDNFNEQDRVFLDLPHTHDVLCKNASYEIVGAMRGMIHVTYLLAKR